MHMPLILFFAQQIYSSGVYAWIEWHKDLRVVKDKLTSLKKKPGEISTNIFK